MRNSENQEWNDNNRYIGSYTNKCVDRRPDINFTPDTAISEITFMGLNLSLSSRRVSEGNKCQQGILGIWVTFKCYKKSTENYQNVPATLSIKTGFLISKRFCGFKSMWQTLWLRRYLSARASCCKNFRQTCSANLCFRLIKLDRSPPSQYSITI